MGKKGTNNIVSGANVTFGFTVLGRRVWAGEAKRDAIGGEKGAEGEVEEFTAIVALHTLSHDMKLGMDKDKKTLEMGGSIGFVSQRESPRIMGKIIKHIQIIFVAREARHRRGP